MKNFTLLIFLIAVVSLSYGQKTNIKTKSFPQKIEVQKQEINETTSSVSMLTPENDVSIEWFAPINEDCQKTDEEMFTLRIMNRGSANLSTDIPIQFSINEGQVSPSTISLADTVVIPNRNYEVEVGPFDLATEGAYYVKVENLWEDDDNAENDIKITKVVSTTHTIKVELKTDTWASETSWELFSYDGELIGANGRLLAEREYTDEFCVVPGCYYFKLYDSYGDGIYSSDDVFGTVKVYYDDVLVGSLSSAADAQFGTEFLMIQIGEGCPVNDANFLSLDLQQYQLINADMDIKGKVQNFGTANITSIDVAYAIDEGDEVSSTISDIDVAPGEIYEFVHGTPAILTATGSYNVKAVVGSVNGVDDENDFNNELEKDVVVVNTVPTKRVFGEEATGTWCGWCPRGAVYMDSMALKYPDTWVGVAVHNGDPMVVTDYDSEIGGFIGGYPSGLVDRVGEFDPSQFESAYMEQINLIPPVDLNIVNLLYNETTRAISFDVQGLFITDLTADLRFNAIIIENNVTGTDGGYNQANYYSGGGAGPMAGWEDKLNPVPALNMEYQFVARAILGGWSGTENSIPATIAADEVASQSYVYSLPEEFDHTNIKIIGAVIDQSNDAVLNVVQVSLGYDDVEEMSSIENVSVYPNPAIDNIIVGFEINHNQDVSIHIVDMMGKEVKNLNFANVQAGTYNTQMDLSNLSQGIYLVQIKFENETVTRKINVIK
jgi:Secretion system C-terminal sorting domain/Outer membrane protein Omp28/CARDB